MATITITVPDNIAPKLLLALKYGHPFVDTTGLTGVAAAKKIIREMLREEYRAWLVAGAKEQIMASAQTQIQAAEVAATEEMGGIDI